MDDLERIRQFLERQPGLELEGRTAERLAGDASSRRYFRVGAPLETRGRIPSDSGKRAGRHSAILTLYPDSFNAEETASQRLDRLLGTNPDAMLSYANDPLAQIEMTRFLADQGLPVPSLLGVSGELGIVAFSDLGDVRLYEALEAAAQVDRRGLYEAAIDLIVELQRATPALLQSEVIGARLEFSAPKLMWEMDFFLNHYFDGYLGQGLTEEERRTVRGELEPLCAWLATRPQVLCHRDYHARNLMQVDDALYLIDYQDGRRGPATYDLASLLLDPYVPSSWVDVDHALERYCAGRNVARDEDFEQEWRAMTVQRLLKAAGTYAFQTARRGNTGFEQYLLPTLERVARVLSTMDGLQTTLTLIGRRRE